MANNHLFFPKQTISIGKIILSMPKFPVLLFWFQITGLPMTWLVQVTAIRVEMVHPKLILMLQATRLLSTEWKSPFGHSLLPVPKSNVFRPAWEFETRCYWCPMIFYVFVHIIGYIIKRQEVLQWQYIMKIFKTLRGASIGPGAWFEWPFYRRVRRRRPELSPRTVWL